VGAVAAVPTIELMRSNAVSASTPLAIDPSNGIQRIREYSSSQRPFTCRIEGMSRLLRHDGFKLHCNCHRTATRIQAFPFFLLHLPPPRRGGRAQEGGRKKSNHNGYWFAMSVRASASGYLHSGYLLSPSRPTAHHVLGRASRIEPRTFR
jgi:hypothetical protein